MTFNFTASIDFHKIILICLFLICKLSVFRNERFKALSVSHLNCVLSDLIFICKLRRIWIGFNKCSSWLRNGHLKTQKRIKTSWDLFAFVASKSWFELSIHQINNNRFVSSSKGIPMFFSNDFIFSVVRVRSFNIWFFNDSVKIFM